VETGRKRRLPEENPNPQQLGEKGKEAEIIGPPCKLFGKRILKRKAREKERRNISKRRQCSIPPVRCEKKCVVGKEYRKELEAAWGPSFLTKGKKKRINITDIGCHLSED